MVRTDSKGVKIAEELIGGARREGRKFLRYHYDNPAIQGDEETGSPKLGYAVSFTRAQHGPEGRHRLRDLYQGRRRVIPGACGPALPMRDLSRGTLAHSGAIGVRHRDEDVSSVQGLAASSIVRR